MSRMWKRLASIIVAVALLVTIVPINPVKADSIYFQFTDFSTVQSSPTVVNTSTVDLRGAFSDVSASSITFKVERLVNGSVVASSNGSLTPSIVGNTFLFAGVQLYEGLNKITVMGTSGNGSGGIVEGVSYVSYGNVPVITSIQLANGTPLIEGQSVVVTTPNPSILVKASNATDVLINGIAMFNGGAGTFVLSDLNLQIGLNKLQIVSRNGDKSFTVDRSVVYFKNSTPTPYNVYAGTVQLDGSPIIAPFTGSKITGRVIFKTPSTTINNPEVTLELRDESGTIVTGGTAATTVTKVTSNAEWTEFSFTSNSNLTANISGQYQLWVKSDSYDGATANFPLAFTVRSATAPYITDVRQLYDVSFTGLLASYSSSTKFANNAAVSQVPLWIALDTSNFTLSATETTTISAKVNGVAVTGSTFSADAFTNSDGTQRIYRINALPQGEIELSLTVKKGSEQNTVTRTFQYDPISSIQVTNTYNGAIYYKPLTSLEGRLLNFTASDMASFKLSLNGVEYNVGSQVNAATGVFAITLPVNLVFGSNEIILSGTANGVQVSTTLMIYRFSDTQPGITKLIPVPYTVNPLEDQTSQRLYTDPDNKFIPGSTANSYTTSQKKADLLFTVTNLANLIVKVDGVDYATASVDSGNIMTVTSTDTGKLFLEPSNSVEKTYNLRLFGLTLPTSGSKSITIISQVGTESVSQTVTITRELPPYELLSPKLPQEAVINQNFLNISIRAEGADKVLIGKVEMDKNVTDDIFRYELQGLKSGTNKIKFTVYRGSDKLDGEFSVNYAADNSIGAQYKTGISSAGKLSVFKGEFALSFPKNTLLRPANVNPGQDVSTVDLFDNQQILVGIADRSDGRTVKSYNAVGEYDSAGTAKDGTFSTVSYSDFGAAVIRPTSHFGFASNLFWVDAGYVEGTIQTGYTFKQGKQPYTLGNEFFSRPLTRWLETSNPGEVTIKYDSAIRDAAASTLSIWRYYNGQWSNMGGTVSTSKNTVTAPIDGFGYYVVMQLRYSFTDIIGHSYARNSLELMYGRGIMNSKNNSEFGVYDNITRGEFAQLLVKMFQIPLDYNPNDMTFDDVVPVLGLSPFWDYRYIETAVRKGIVRGKGPRQFLPNESLTREEAAVMIARAADLIKNTAEDQTKDRATLQKSFTDANSVDGYALSSVIAVVKAKFLEGMPNTTTGTAKPTYRFDPKSNLKRADAAIIAERVMRKNKLL